MRTRNVIILFILVITLIAGMGVQFSYADENELGVRYTPSEVTVESGNSTLSIMRISASDTSGLHSILLTLIGDYNPIVKDYTYTSSSGYTSHQIDIQPDWSWIMTAALFIVVIFCVFRFVGGLFS